jgi:general L-amino acid transport system substrate-binding protein
MVNAEALGVNQRNVKTMLDSENLSVRSLLGQNGSVGRKLGLQNDFCYEVIQQVGSYKDVYDRHLGPQSPFNLPRGKNGLSNDGGLHYPLPFK